MTMAALARRIATTAVHQLRSMAATSSNPRSLELHQSIVQGMERQALGIPIRSDNVQVLSTPSSFYESLKQAAADSKHRISVASLYLGSGRLERDLLDVIADNVVAKPSLRATFLFDALRSTRPTASGRSSDMLSDRLFSKCESSDRITVSLYQTPDLNRALKLLLPYRLNEVVGVCHLKAYVFDDDVLISGANLNESYFTNRQDRYIWLRNSKQLADFFADLIDLVSSFSYKLDDRGDMIPNSSLIDPLEQPLTFKTTMAERLRALLSARATSSNSGTGSLFCKGAWSDTWVFPAVQMGPLGIHQDELCTLWLLKHLTPESRVHLASAYFNLTPELQNAVLEAANAKKVSILTASPEANGFYGASGVSGYIPHAYSLLAKGLYQRGKQSNNERTGLHIHEYRKPDWTFHAKGLWCSLPEEEAPSISLIGSSNFGYRSRHRDLEAQLFIVTLDPNLRSQLERERTSLYSFAAPVVDSSLSGHDRLASFAARAIRSWL